MMNLSFQSGEGRHFNGGVNFMIGKDAGVILYAECPVPEGASEDYGYITLKQAIEAKIEGRGLDVRFWYDGQEQYLEPDAHADCETWTDCEVGND